MYLVPRLIGISVYLLITILAVFFLSKVNTRQTRLILLIYLVQLSVVAFFYYPDQYSDLFRVRIYARTCASTSWNDLIGSIINNTSGLASTPAAMVYYKLVGSLNNEGFISAITCCLVFGILFYILYDYKSRHKISNRIFAITILLLMAMDFFIPIIATVRSYIATALIIFCIYREYEQKKFGLFNIVMYVIAALMHSIGAALILFRVVAYIFFNDDIQNKTKKIILTAGVLMIAVAFFPYYINIMNTSYAKAVAYLDNGSYTYIWERILCIIQTIYILIAIYRSKKMNVFAQYMGKYKHMIMASAILLIICNIQFSFLVRFTFFVELLALPLVMALLSVEREQGIRKTYYYTVATIAITLILTCSRGYLCSLKFWM